MRMAGPSIATADAAREAAHFRVGRKSAASSANHRKTKPPAVPEASTGIPDRKWSSGVFSIGSMQQPLERPQLVRTTLPSRLPRRKHAPSFGVPSTPRHREWVDRILALDFRLAIVDMVSPHRMRGWSCGRRIVVSASGISPSRNGTIAHEKEATMASDAFEVVPLGLNLRSSTQVTPGNRIAVLPQGTRVTRLDDADDIDWCKVRANALFDWLNEHGSNFGLRRSFSLDEVQENANGGRLGLIVAQRHDLNRSGHISVVVPEHGDNRAARHAGKVERPLQTQAGMTNRRWFNGPSAWRRGQQFREFGFWTHQG
jgi:hypothetical protein